MRKPLRVVALLVTLGTTGVFGIACASQPMTAPSPVNADTTTTTPAPATSGTLTIRVLSRVSGDPISGAAIDALSARGATDASGLFALAVTPGQEMDVQVSASGYESMGASAVVGANERWTFYLPPSEGTTPPAGQ